MALPLNNTFEGSSDETTVTTGNSGGGSGDAFGSVVIDASNGVVYDSAKAAHGSFSCRMDIATANRTAVSWQSAQTGGSILECWGRLYYWNSAAPTVGIRLAALYQAGVLKAGLVHTSGGLLRVSDSASASDDTIAAIPTSTWVRVEFHVIVSATVGQIEARLYLADATSPITNGTVSSAATRNTGTAIDEVAFGNTTFNAQTVQMWIDDLQLNGTGWPGPATGGIQTLLPDADVTTTGWTTAPLYSKLNDGTDATIITATAS